MVLVIRLLLAIAFILFLATITYFKVQTWRRAKFAAQRNAEVLANQPDDPFNPLAAYPVSEIKAKMTAEPDPETVRIETPQKVYDHFGYEIRGISFADYVRKVDAGTHAELAGMW